MPDTTIYHLNPRSAFHFGVRGLEQEATGVRFPSDSLFAALLTARMETGCDPAAVTDLFPQYPDGEQTPPFTLTSVFPRAGSVRFYPALPLRFLLSPPKLDALNRAHRLKEVKKIRFISEKLFLMAAAGQWLDDYVPSETATDDDAGRYMQGSALWLTGAEVEQLPPTLLEKVDRYRGSPAKALRHTALWKQGKVPRVAVDRVSSASNIFFTGRLRFNRDCGLWFGVRWAQPDAPLSGGTTARQTLETALHILGDSGIGAERSAGYGQFTVDTASPPTAALPEPTRGGLFVTLSRFHPTPADPVFGDSASYNLEAVAGWIRSPVEAAQRRRRLWFITEGSVLQYGGGRLPGSLVDVRPKYNKNEDKNKREFSHPVWRYGLAFPVGIANGREQ